MPLPGGASDKYGNRYEGRWTAFCMAQILDEQACSIRLEPPGAEEKGFEFWLNRKDRTEYHQIKRQKSRGGTWTLNNLSSEGILNNFLTILLNDNNYCVFVSTQNAYELDELSDRARRAVYFNEFKTKFLESKEIGSRFDYLCQIWRSSEEDAYKLLKRIEIRSIDEDTLQKFLAVIIKPLVVGEPMAVAEILANLALDDVHKELSAHDIWQRLENRGLERRVWNKDPHVLNKVSGCTHRNLPADYDSTIAGKWIERDETKIILNKLSSSDSKKTILISGEAGVGKSCIIKQVVGELQNQGMPILLFRVDRLNATQLPENVGAQLGLPDSPPIVLKAIALDHPCILIIDQLDWVSQISGRNPGFFDCIYEIINQALNYPEMRVLLACRKFDLDNDHRLRRLVEKNGIAESIQIKYLAHETIKQFIKNELNLDINQLNQKHLDLLSIPLHLSLLAQISQDSKIDVIDFETTKDLYDKFWEIKGIILNQRREGSSNWAEVIFSLSSYMSEYQTLIAPASILDKFGTLPEIMTSEHILIKDDNKYAFFHQGFFDYAFSRNFCAQGLSLIPFLENDFQHLFRRAQVMQILLQERDDNFQKYIADLESMLNSQMIRYHLKKIAFAVLSDLKDPKIDEWRVIAEFIDNPSDPRSKEVKYILNKSNSWIDLLISEGQLLKWLEDKNEETINLAIQLLSKIQKDKPEVVLNFIHPYIDVSDIWNQRVGQILKTCKVDACKSFYKFVLHAIEKGILDNIEELNPLEGYFWYDQKDFIKDHPEWACEFIGHYLNRKHITGIIKGQLNPFSRDHIRDGEVVNSIFKCAKMSPYAFICELLPLILRLIGLNSYIDKKIAKSPFYDKIWRHRYYYDRFGFYISDCILSAMEDAIASLAKIKPDNFRIIANELDDLEYDTIHYLLIRGFAANGELLFKDAAKYLTKYPICFETGYVEDRFKAAKDLLLSITPYCQNDLITQIEGAIFGKFKNGDDCEKAQFYLLNGIASDHRSEFADNRLKKLEKKFGLSVQEPPRMFGGGFVVSPISETEAYKLSDAEWLEAISRYDSEEGPFELDVTNLVGGAFELSHVLQKKCQQNPLRFAELIKKFPDNANIHYFDGVLQGISNTNLNIKLKLDVCRRCHDLRRRPCGRRICDVIKKIADSDLPNDALDIVAWYAIEDLDPEYEEWRAEDPTKTVYYGGDIITAGLNSARGSAADAMASLIFYNKSRITYLKSSIEKMVKDPSIEVRSWVAETLISILRHDREYAIKLFQDLCDTEDILLSTRHAEVFLGYVLWDHFSQLRPILRRMMMSTEMEVAKAGARRVCIASFELDEARPMMELCVNGTVDQRLGAAEVFSSNLKSYPDLCIEKLTLFFRDENEKVREQASSCFRQLINNDLGNFSGLIEEFIESPSFETNIDDLVWALKKTNSKLPGLIYYVCHKFIHSTILSNNRNFHEEMDISNLVLRLYSQNKDTVIGKNCLDLIDIMIENYVYRIDKELSNYER